MQNNERQTQKGSKIIFVITLIICLVSVMAASVAGIRYYTGRSILPNDIVSDINETVFHKSSIKISENETENQKIEYTDTSENSSRANEQIDNPNIIDQTVTYDLLNNDLPAYVDGELNGEFHLHIGQSVRPSESVWRGQIEIYDSSIVTDSGDGIITAIGNGTTTVIYHGIGTMQRSFTIVVD